MIGSKLAHYTIEEKLGGGGMGVVYRAKDTKLRRQVALKVLHKDRAVSEEARKRFLNEALMAAALHHPNICTVYDFGEEEGLSYISMAYIPGRSIADIVSEGPLAVDRALKIAVQIANALKAAHNHKIIHRDIKGANVIVGDDGRVTILDFGIAKLGGQPTQTGKGETLGTVAYMSPEQATGEVVDPRTDIWSLGVCLYEMLAGELPFKGYHDSAVFYQIVHQDAPSLSDKGVEVPALVETIIEKAMSKQRERRYKRIDEMLDDLERAVGGAEAKRAGEEPSIAILPFMNMSDDAKQTYFCDGIAEEIINALTHVGKIRVVSRTSSFAFRDSKEDARKIGRKLGVQSLLEGSVQKAGNRLRITTQLVDVADGYHLWSERFDRELEDVFAIQDEIARNVVDALKVTLTDTEKAALEKVPTTDMEAYDFYIRGKQHYYGMDKKSLDLARNLFTSAIIRDPNYALAYCGLSDCYSMVLTFHDTDKANVENALTASRRALELDGELAEAHASVGLALSLGGKYEEAEAEFERAIELAPKLFEAYYFYARSRRAQGKLEKAAELFEKAHEVRPEEYEAIILGAGTYRGLDRDDDVRRCFEIGIAAVEKHLEHHPKEARGWYFGAHALHELGDVDKALEWNEKAMQLAPRDPATLYNAACLFSLMGKIDKAFECLNRAVEHGFANRTWTENDPDLDAIRKDPRYEELLKEMPE